MTNPTEDDILVMSRVLQYLYVTRNSPLVFTPGKWVGPDGWEHEPLELQLAFLLMLTLLRNLVGTAKLDLL